MTTVLPIPDELTGLITQVLGVDRDLITPEASFTDLGRTSAQEVELFVAIEDQYRITLDFETFFDLTTVGDLSNAIATATAEEHSS